MADMIFCTGDGCAMRRHCARNTRTPEDKVGDTGIPDPVRYEVFLKPPFIIEEDQGCNYFWPEAFGEMIAIEISPAMTMKMGPPIPIREMPKTFEEAAAAMPEEPIQIPPVPGGEMEQGTILEAVIGKVEPPPIIKGQIIPNEVDLSPSTIHDYLVAPAQPDFTIRAQDKGGPEIILEWIKRAGAYGSTPEKLRAAFGAYLDMVKWQRDNPVLVKTPD